MCWASLGQIPSLALPSPYEGLGENGVSQGLPGGLRLCGATSRPNSVSARASPFALLMLLYKFYSKVFEANVFRNHGKQASCSLGPYCICFSLGI